MPLHRDPRIDIKRMYPIHRQLGAIAALGVTIAAFTIPLPRGEEDVLIEDGHEIIELETVDQTQQLAPPPPPPPAAPPPQEVPDDVRVEEDVIEDVSLDLTEIVLAPPAPPTPTASPPAPAVAPPPPPPPPPLPEPAPHADEIFEVAEVQPELIGGLAGLQARVEYPEIARLAEIQGRVIVQFVVDERGNVIDPVVLRSAHDALSEAAVRAVVGSRFTPGQQRGRPVKVRYAVPITFQLVGSTP